MWSPTPPQKTQGLEGGKPQWVDSFLINEVCPILSETFLGWKLLLLDFGTSLLTLGFRIGMTIYGSKYCHLPSLIRFAGLLHWHTAGVNCGFVSSLQGRQGGEGFGQWWNNLLRIRITKELFEWNMLGWKKKSQESLGLWESFFFPGFWAFCWYLLLPSWFIWLLCITTDEKCHASSKSCNTYVETSNQRPTHKPRIYQAAGRWAWIASIRVPWLQIVTEDWSFFPM